MEGDTFQAGIVDGPAGEATLVSIEPHTLTIDFVADDRPLPGLDAITLIVGLPRPQTARKVLQEATSLGVQRIHFVRSELGERSYAHSPLWKDGEWRRLLIAGAQQAVTTRIPSITVARKLIDVLSEEEARTKLALDNYEAGTSISEASASLPAIVAVGSERGWTPSELALLRDAGFEVVHLGRRVLRVETACVAALTLVRSKTGLA